MAVVGHRSNLVLRGRFNGISSHFQDEPDKCSQGSCVGREKQAAYSLDIFLTVSGNDLAQAVVKAESALGKNRKVEKTRNASVPDNKGLCGKDEGVSHRTLQKGRVP